MVQNASTQLALRLVREHGQLSVGVYAIAPLRDVQVTLAAHGQPFYENTFTLEPGQSWLAEVSDNGDARVTMTVTGADGATLLQYEEHIAQELPLPSAAVAPALPEALSNTDELYFIGQHLEQYNHASRYAEDYYRRALDVDPLDYRNNVALGTLALNRADWALAAHCAGKALERAHKLNKTRVMARRACYWPPHRNVRATMTAHGIIIIRPVGAATVGMRLSGR